MNLNELEIGSASIGGSKTLYMGIAPIQIIMVNPSVSQLAEFYNTDVDKIKEPSYVKDGETPSTRLDFYYTNHPDFDKQFKGKFAIFVQGNTRESKAGKKQYIDAFTRTSWSNNLSELSAAQESVKDFFGEKLLKTKISSNIALAEAPSQGKDIFLYNKACKGASDYNDLCNELFDKKVA